MPWIIYFFTHSLSIHPGFLSFILRPSVLCPFFPSHLSSPLPFRPLPSPLWLLVCLWLLLSTWDSVPFLLSPAPPLVSGPSPTSLAPPLPPVSLALPPGSGPSPVSLAPPHLSLPFFVFSCIRPAFLKPHYSPKTMFTTFSNQMPLTQHLKNLNTSFSVVSADNSRNISCLMRYIFPECTLK